MFKTTSLALSAASCTAVVWRAETAFFQATTVSVCLAGEGQRVRKSAAQLIHGTEGAAILRALYINERSNDSRYLVNILEG